MYFQCPKPNDFFLSPFPRSSLQSCTHRPTCKHTLTQSLALTGAWWLHRGCLLHGIVTSVGCKRHSEPTTLTFIFKCASSCELEDSRKKSVRQEDMVVQTIVFYSFNLPLNSFVWSSAHHGALWDIDREWALEQWFEFRFTIYCLIIYRGRK